MRPALFAALACALTASGAEPPHPSQRDGVWVQATPLELSYAIGAVDPLSFLPWLPVTFGADVGPLQFGVGLGVRPLVRDVLVLASPVLRWQIATPSPRLGAVAEVRLHAGILPRTGLLLGGGAGLGLEVFLLDWLSLSPLLGLDALAGSSSAGSWAGGVGVLGSARVAINAVF